VSAVLDQRLRVQQADGRAGRVPGKHLRHFLPEVTADDFAEHVAEVRCNRQVASLEELLRLQPRPAAVDLSAPDRTADDQTTLQPTGDSRAATFFATHQPRVSLGRCTFLMSDHDSPCEAERKPAKSAGLRS
jgi:hypothetical protein